MVKRYTDYITLVFFGTLYVFAVIKASLLGMHVPVTAWQMLLFALSALLFYCLLSTKAGKIAFLSVCTIAIVYIIYALIRGGLPGLEAALSPVIRLAQIMVQIGTGYYDESISISWLMLSVGIFAVIIAMPVYNFLIRDFRFYLLIVPGIAFFILVWGLMRYVDRTSFYIFIVITIILFIQHRYFAQQKQSNANSKKSSDGIILIYFVPVALAIIMVSALIPVKALPIKWEWMDNKIADLWSDLDTKFSVDRYDRFTLAETGFGDSSNLGGSVRPDNTLVMVVKAPTRVYLRGAVYDTYTGTGWESNHPTDVEYINDRIADQRELLHGWKALMFPILERSSKSVWEIPNFTRNNITNLDDLLEQNSMPDLLRKLYPEEELEVEYRKLRTKSLFTPLKLFLPIAGLTSDYIIQENVDSIFYANKRLKEGSKYNINYLQPAYGMYELEQFLSSSRIGAYRDFNNSIDYYIKLSKNTRKTENIESSLSEAIALFDLLEKRRDEIQNMYMQIPDSISINTVNLARDLTRNKINTFEKVKAIENYLSRNFHYTLSPQIPPADKDFVEHFLFDGKEGYCSYYASAMCILARISGIPARYVEGFVLPGESTEDGYYYVTNHNAHAWVEVYFEGIGWVTFEPTSPMEGAMDYFVSLSNSSDNISLEDDEQFNDFDDLDEIDDEQLGNNGDQDFAAGIGRNNNISFGIFALALMTAIILLWIVNMIYILIRKVVLRLFLKKKTAVLLYNYSISLLKQAGRHVRSGETPLDFGARIDELYKFSDMNMKSFVEVYYSVRFGLKTLDKKTIRRLFNFVGELKKESGSNMYIVKRILYRGLLFNG